jgi:hypothetical protein
VKRKVSVTISMDFNLLQWIQERVEQLKQETGDRVTVSGFVSGLIEKEQEEE